jgi:hypothetical protein
VSGAVIANPDHDRNKDAAIVVALQVSSDFINTVHLKTLTIHINVIAHYWYKYHWNPPD